MTSCLFVVKGEIQPRGAPAAPQDPHSGKQGLCMLGSPTRWALPSEELPRLGKDRRGVVSHGTSPPKSPLWFSALLPGSNMEKRDVRVSGSHFPGPFCALFPALSGDSPSETWTDGRNGGWILGVPAGLLPGGSRRLILTHEACAGR